MPIEKQVVVDLRRDAAGERGRRGCASYALGDLGRYERSCSRSCARQHADVLTRDPRDAGSSSDDAEAQARRPRSTSSRSIFQPPQDAERRSRRRAMPTLRRHPAPHHVRQEDAADHARHEDGRRRRSCAARRTRSSPRAPTPSGMRETLGELGRARRAASSTRCSTTREPRSASSVRRDHVRPRPLRRASTPTSCKRAERRDRATQRPSCASVSRRARSAARRREYFRRRRRAGREHLRPIAARSSYAQRRSDRRRRSIAALRRRRDRRGRASSTTSSSRAITQTPRASCSCCRSRRQPSRRPSGRPRRLHQIEPSAAEAARACSCRSALEVADLPRAAREPGRRARRAHDGDGVRDATTPRR